MNNWHDGYKPFLPEVPTQGKIGYYPCSTVDEWNSLPLPLRCATWYDGSVEAVIFDTWFDNYKIKATIEIHPQNAFKALFTLSNGGTQLYSICGVRLRDGTRRAAKWFQDTTSGTFSITESGGHVYGEQGGYRQHFPAIIEVKDDGTYNLDFTKAAPGTICHFE